MPPFDLTSRRQVAQHIAKPLASTPAAIVRSFGAVQAQDYLGSLWAIGLRLADATEGAVEQAIADRSIVRTWPMRGTIHYVPPEDARWMLALMGAQVAARHRRRLIRQFGLDATVLSRSARVLEKAMQGREPVTRSAAYAILRAAGIPTDGMRGLHILWWLAQQGMICFGPRAGKQPTFVLLDEWVAHPRRLDRDEAIAELVLRYYTSHGPATVQDFTWWSGLGVAETKLGLDNARGKLEQQVLDGRTYWFAPSDAGARVAASPVLLLPPFDEYTVAYRDRRALLDAAPRALTMMEILGPVIVAGGHIVGKWKRAIKKDKVVLTPTLYVNLTRPQARALEQACERYGRFIGLPVDLEDSQSLAG